MNWHPVRPIDRRTGELCAPTPYAIRSDCGRFQISKMIVRDDPGYLLWDITARPPRSIGPTFPTADAAKQHAEEIA